MGLDKEKLLEWLESQRIQTSGFASYFDCGMSRAFRECKEKIEAGNFDIKEELPAITDFHSGNQVRHIEHAHYGIGEVRGWSKSGKRVKVMFAYIGWTTSYHPKSLIKV